MIGARCGAVVTAALLAALGSASCAGPSRTTDDFHHKASSTARATTSAVETALLVQQSFDRRRLFGSYAAVVISEAEDDASSAQNTFDSVQPPAGDNQDLRSALDEVLDAVGSDLSDLRIAVRRGDRAAARTAAAGLRSHEHALAGFAST